MKMTTKDAEAKSVVTIASIIDDWYEPTDANHTVLGQITYAVTSYREPYYLRPYMYCDEDGSFDTLKIVCNPDELPRDDTLFHRKTSFTSPPLETNEEMIMYRHKQRPVILLGGYGSEDMRPCVDKSNYYVCLPLYSIRNNYDGDLKPLFTEEQVYKVQRLQIRNLLFLPADTRFRIKDSYIDYDRAQIIHESLLDRNKPTKLSGMAISLVVNRLLYYCSDRMLSEQEDPNVYYWKEIMETNY
jgi:hypothetical protein